ncbi:MAG: glycosyltransferase family 4 protein [Clostridia bacterium]|nr:glycosyltransferase family 4 protein [Clostridia bacterium]
MNIIVYTHHYPSPKEIGLTQDTKVIHYFAKKLVEKGHRVQVVHLSYWPVKEFSIGHLRHIWPVMQGYEIEGVPVRLIQYQMLTPRRFYPEWFQAWIINAQLRRMKKELGWTADKVFVHFPTTFTGLGEIFADCPCTLGDFHNMDCTLLRGRDKHGKMLRFISRLNTWGCRNKRVREFLTSCGRMPVPVYTGIEAELLGSPTEIEAKKQQPGGLKLIYVGQLIPLKNVDTLIETVKRLGKDAELTIVGDGQERQRLEEMAGGCGNITFTGWLPREEALQRMKQADIFAMVSSPETYGMVYLEAMAQGCIPIASRGEGFDGLIRDGENGFLLPPGDADALVALLNRIANLTQEERCRLIDNAYALACAMTEDQTTEGFLQANSLHRPEQAAAEM